MTLRFGLLLPTADWNNGIRMCLACLAARGKADGTRPTDAEPVTVLPAMSIIETLLSAPFVT
jgi:hypothetical protein